MSGTRAKPLPYQKEGVEDIEDFDGRALLADDMGLGKTLQALWFIRRERIPTMPVVVVCPASVKYNWEREAAQHVLLQSSMLEGQAPPNKRTLVTPPPLTIINYDILQYWVPYLRQLNPTTVILDECQNLQNPNTKRTKAVRALCRGVRNVVALSGTPLTNRPAELWPTLNIIRPDIFPSFFHFAMEFCRPHRAPWGWEFKGAENLDKLHALLRRTCMIRRLKKDVTKDLPSKVRRVCLVPLSNRTEYDHANNDFRGWLKQHQADRFARATRAEQLTKIGYLLRLCGKLKLRGVVQWITRFLEETDEKLVVFGVHQKMIEALARRVEEKSVVVTGSVTGRARDLAITQFRKDKETRLLIANMLAAGTGTNGLQEVANTMAFVEMAWRPGDHTQAEDRIHRIGQSETAWINYLVAGNTVEEKLCRIIQEKQQVLRATLDGGEAPENDLNILDKLIAEMNT